MNASISWGFHPRLVCSRPSASMASLPRGLLQRASISRGFHPKLICSRPSASMASLPRGLLRLRFLLVRFSAAAEGGAGSWLIRALRKSLAAEIIANAGMPGSWLASGEVEAVQAEPFAPYASAAVSLCRNGVVCSMNPRNPLACSSSRLSVPGSLILPFSSSRLLIFGR